MPTISTSGCSVEQRLHAVARQLLVVDDEGADLCGVGDREGSHQSAAVSFVRVKGNRHRDVHALPGAPRSEKVLPVAVQMREALASARESDAFLVAGAQSAAVVAGRRSAACRHRGARRCAIEPCAEVAEAVAERVLDERLEEQIRHACVARLGFDVDGDAQPVAEAEGHDLEVALQEVELRLERHFLRADVLERHAEQIAQRRDHRIGAADVLVHERRDRVQRVEEEVRLQLHAQHVELRLRETRLELRRAERAVASRRGSRRRRDAR